MSTSMPPTSGWNAVHLAAMNGHLDVLRELKGWEVDIHATTNTGHNAVHIAVLKGHLDVLRELKSWDVDIHAIDNEGYHTVHHAVWRGNPDVLRALKSSRNVRPSSPPMSRRKRDRHARKQPGRL